MKRINNTGGYTIPYDYNKKCDSSKYKYTPAILPKANKIVVFGDIHGDLELAVNLLTRSNVAQFIDDINKIMRYDPFFVWNSHTVKWIGNNTVVVQVGDQVDRCRPIDHRRCDNPTLTKNDEASDILIMNLFNELDRQAIKSNGRVISLLGNHEIMNATDNLDYVSYEGIKQFSRYNRDDPHRGRIDAFKPGGDIGMMMGCTRVPAIIIGSNLFVHAGFVDSLLKDIGIDTMDKNKARKRLETINREVRGWLLGTVKKEVIEPIIRSSKNSMFWTRLLGKIPPNVDMSNPRCTKNIVGVLEIFQLNSIFIGHTPGSFTFNPGSMINSTCSGKVWRVDQGSSKAFNEFDIDWKNTGNINSNRDVQWVEIHNDTEYTARK